MMYHLDGRRRRQSLVYFGEPQASDLAYGHTRNPYIYICMYLRYRRYVCMYIHTSSIHVYRPRRMTFENRPLRLTPNSEVESLISALAAPARVRCIQQKLLRGRSPRRHRRDVDYSSMSYILLWGGGERACRSSLRVNAQIAQS